jgi:hypothetical protein
MFKIFRIGYKKSNNMLKSRQAILDFWSIIKTGEKIKNHIEGETNE